MNMFGTVFFLALGLFFLIGGVSMCMAHEAFPGLLIAITGAACVVAASVDAGVSWARCSYTCEQAQLERYERRTIDGREEQCMPDGRVWRLPVESE